MVRGSGSVTEARAALTNNVWGSNVKRDTAEYLNSLILEFSSRLSDSVGVVKEKCSKDEAETYLKPVSQMLALGFDVLDFIHEQYPDLKPASMDD